MHKQAPGFHPKPRVTTRAQARWERAVLSIVNFPLSTLGPCVHWYVRSALAEHSYRRAEEGRKCNVGRVLVLNNEVYGGGGGDSTSVGCLFSTTLLRGEVWQGARAGRRHRGRAAGLADVRAHEAQGVRRGGHHVVPQGAARHRDRGGGAGGGGGVQRRPRVPWHPGRELP